jgi:UDP-glucose 4-epimerase
MLQNKVAITGATSATALWIARAFSLKGWNTLALCSRAEESYSGIKKERLKWLKTQAQVSFDVRAETDGFADWIKINKPAIWVHHHHLVENYKGSDYDYTRSRKEGVAPLIKLVEALKENNCRGIILTGSYFEPGEKGANNTPYGKSKAEVSKALESLTSALKIRFSKIVIPDPVGPLENEERFLPQFLKAIRENRGFNLTTPDLIADHISMEELGKIYEEAGRDLLVSKGKVSRPSGWVGTYRDWADFIRGEKDNSWTIFFREYARYLKTHEPWRAK